MESHSNILYQLMNTKVIFCDELPILGLFLHSILGWVYFCWILVQDPEVKRIRIQGGSGSQTHFAQQFPKCISRRPSILVASAIQIVTSIIAAFSVNYIMFIVFRLSISNKPSQAKFNSWKLTIKLRWYLHCHNPGTFRLDLSLVQYI
jgi:hypothetical protein